MKSPQSHKEEFIRDQKGHCSFLRSDMGTCHFREFSLAAVPEDRWEGGKPSRKFYNSSSEKRSSELG